MRGNLIIVEFGAQLLAYFGTEIIEFSFGTSGHHRGGVMGTLADLLNIIHPITRGLAKYFLGIGGHFRLGAVNTHNIVEAGPLQDILDLGMLSQYGNSTAYLEHVAIRGYKSVDSVAIEVFQVTEINHDIPHIVFNHETDGVLQFRGIEDLVVAHAHTDDVKNPYGSDIELDKKPPVKPSWNLQIYRL